MRSLFYLLILLSLVACQDRQEMPSENFYFDYKIRAEEESEQVTVLLHFREGQNKAAHPLPGNSQVLLDQDTLNADSSKYGGFYYEVQRPLDQFAGSHTITALIGGNRYEETFNFQPIVLAREIPQVLRREDWEIPLRGTLEGEPVWVIITDTSFLSDDINMVDTVRNNRLTIKRDDLRNLEAGPLLFQLFKLERIPVNGMGSGGRILIEYGMKRESELVD